MTSDATAANIKVPSEWRELVIEYCKKFNIEICDRNLKGLFCYPGETDIFKCVNDYVFNYAHGMDDMYIDEYKNILIHHAEVLENGVVLETRM